jgi:ribonuclease Z
MAVTYLGSSSGAPTRDRNVSCTVLRLPESLYLVDCGEGSSRQAKLTGIKLEQVRRHCLGRRAGEGGGVKIVRWDMGR